MNRTKAFTSPAFDSAASDLRRHILRVAKQYSVKVLVTLYHCSIAELHTVAHDLVDYIRDQQNDLSRLQQAHSYLDELDLSPSSALNQPLDVFPDPLEGYETYGLECDDFDLLASDLNGYAALDLRERRSSPTVAPVYNAAVARLSSPGSVSNLAARPHLLYKQPLRPISVADLVFAYDHNYLDETSAMLLLPLVYRARHRLQEQWCDMPTSINGYRLVKPTGPADPKAPFRLAGLTVVVDFGPYGTLDRYLNHCVLPRLDYYYARDDPDQFPYSYCYLHLVHVQDRLLLISDKGAPQRSLHLFNASVASRMRTVRPAAALLRLYMLDDGSLHVSNSQAALTHQPYVPLWPPMFNRLLAQWFDEYGPQPNKRHGFRLFRLAQTQAVQADLWKYDALLAAQNTDGYCTKNKAPTSAAPAVPPMRFLPSHRPVLYLTDPNHPDLLD